MSYNYVEGLAYSLDPATRLNRAFPDLPGSTPYNVNPVISYDVGTNSIYRNSTSGNSGVDYYLPYDINPNDYAVYAEFYIGSASTGYTNSLSFFNLLNLCSASLSQTESVTLPSGPTSVLNTTTMTATGKGTRLDTITQSSFVTPPISVGATDFIAASGLCDGNSGNSYANGWHSALVIYRGNSDSGIQYYLDGVLKFQGSTYRPLSQSNPFLKDLRIFGAAAGSGGSPNVYLRVLNIYSEVFGLSTVTLSSTTPSQGQLPRSYYSTRNKVQRLLTSASTGGGGNVSVPLSGIEVRTDSHRFYYPRPNKMTFKLRGGSNG